MTDRIALVVAALLLAVGFFAPGVMTDRARFDHVVVLDITQSMNVEDVNEMAGEPGSAGRPVSRLDLAKDALRRVLATLPCGSKLGWGIFTEYRALLLLEPVEVCANRAELRATLDRIDGRMAWSGNSEIAKGLHSGIVLAKQVTGAPTLVFVTDGHEAPPLDPRHRPRFDDKPGEVRGVIVGVGALRPSRIPKTDPLGRPLGFWRADEVMQTDARSLGRSGSVGREALVEDGAAVQRDPALETSPGSEHLSSLHEAYLRLLAGEQGLAFHRLQTVEALTRALTDASFARPTTVRADLRPALAALALLALVWRYLPRRWFGRRS